MSVNPIRYAPIAANVPLLTAPRLASWDAAGSPSQARLAAYLAELKRLAAPLLARADGPLAFALDVALPPESDLLVERDLDNSTVSVRDDRLALHTLIDRISGVVRNIRYR